MWLLVFIYCFRNLLTGSKLTGEKSKLLAKSWLSTLVWACVSSNGVDLLMSYYWKSSMLVRGSSLIEGLWISFCKFRYV